MTRTAVPSPGRCSAWNSAFSVAARSANPSSTACRRSPVPSSDTTSSTPPLVVGVTRTAIRVGGRGAPPGRATHARSGRGRPGVLTQRVPCRDVRLDPDPAPPCDAFDEEVHGGREPCLRRASGSSPVTSSRRSLLASRVSTRARSTIARVLADSRRGRGNGRVQHLRDRREMLHRARHGSVLRAASVRLARRGAARRAPACGRQRSIDHRLAQRDRDRLCPGVGLELDEDVTHVALDRLLADEEPRRRRPRSTCRRRGAGGSRAPARVSESPPSRPWIRFGINAGSTNVSPAGDLLDRPQERLVRRLLEDVALRARLEAAREQRPLAVRGEDDPRAASGLA